MPSQSQFPNHATSTTSVCQFICHCCFDGEHHSKLVHWQWLIKVGDKLHFLNGRCCHPSLQQEMWKKENQILTCTQCENAQGNKRQVLQVYVPRRRWGKTNPKSVTFLKVSESGRQIPIIKNLVEKKNLFSFCDGYQNLQCSTTWKPNVFRVTSTQRWKITSMGKVSLCEHLSSPCWPMSEPELYPQVQILHRCIIFSSWAEPVNKQI